MHSLLAFLAVAALVIVVPGQDTALTIRNTLSGSRSSGVATACGVSCGQAVWAVATSLGLAAVLVASEPAYIALKLVGAGYLVWLGASCLWRAARREKPARRGVATRRVRPDVAFRQGLVSNLGNPKMAVFFTSLLPQFTPAGATFTTPLLLGLAFAVLTLVWLALYAVAVAHAARAFERPLIRRGLDAVTGLFLVALGLRLLTGSSRTT
jgi:threonine/homoserine/homoserine lactone efflux protein